MEFAVLPVPQGRSKHALTSIERTIDAPTFDGFQEHFCVGSAAESCPATLHSHSKLAVVVDLSVVGDHPPPTGRDHGLRSAWSEIDDCQTPVTERNPCGSVDPEATVVRPTMLQ